MTIRTLAVATAIAMLPGIGAAYAQDDFPSRAITMVIPYAPGGPTDTSGRIIADEMSRSLGQPVVVENKPGGSMMVGGNYALSQPKDGYTFIMTSIGMFNTQATFKVTPFVPANWQPLSLIQKGPYLLYVNAGLGIDNLADLVKYAKENPGKLNCANVGSSYSSTGVALASFADAAGFKCNEVIYQSAADLLRDLVAGRANMHVNSPFLFYEQVKSGNLKALGVFSEQRVAALPDLPTMSEQGYPVFQDFWLGMFAPAGIPAAAVEKLNAAVHDAVASEKYQSLMKAQLIEGVASTPQELMDLAVTKDYESWLAATKRLGIDIVQQ